jgi:phage shock protein E
VEASKAKPDESGNQTDEAAALIAGGAVVVDVRSQEEFDAGAVDGAVLIPHTEMAARVAEVDALVKGDRGQAVVVYCRAGRRAGAAKADLEAAGFTQVVNGGGIGDLQAALSAAKK